MKGKKQLERHAMVTARKGKGNEMLVCVPVSVQKYMGWQCGDQLFVTANKETGTVVLRASL